MDAYHPKAFYSFSINVNNNAALHNNYRSNYRGDQIKESRNLNHIPPTDGNLVFKRRFSYFLIIHFFLVEKRFRLLHVGHIDTVNFIKNLQPTEHIKESLKLDVSFFMVISKDFLRVKLVLSSISIPAPFVNIFC